MSEEEDLSDGSLSSSCVEDEFVLSHDWEEDDLCPFVFSSEISSSVGETRLSPDVSSSVSESEASPDGSHSTCPADAELPALPPPTSTFVEKIVLMGRDEGGVSSERNSLASPSETDVSCVDAKDNVSCVSSSVKKLDGAEMDGNDEAGDGDSVDGDDNSSVCIVEMSFESGSGGSEFFNFNFGTRFGLTGFPQVVFVHTNLVFV